MPVASSKLSEEPGENVEEFNKKVKAVALKLVNAGKTSAFVMLPFAAPLSVQADEIWLLLVLGLAVLPVSFGLISLGPRYLPAPEVALILLLETVLGPFWVWLVLEEQPSAFALAGGAIVVGALVLHSLAALMAQRGRTGSTPLDPTVKASE